MITTASFLQLVQKHKTEKFLFPMAVGSVSEVFELMKKSDLDVVSTEIYRTIPEELPYIDFSTFDMLLLFSPIGIESIFQNFPDFKQNDIILAVSGKNTADAAIAAGLRVDIMAPSPKYLSMMDAIIDFFKTQASK
jgi:uroporphyrinogen-III synthase